MFVVLVAPATGIRATSFVAISFTGELGIDIPVMREATFVAVSTSVGTTFVTTSTALGVVFVSVFVCVFFDPDEDGFAGSGSVSIFP